MPRGVLLGGLLLAAVFATAGVAKLADLEGSSRAVAAFGVPRRLAGMLGTLLPLAELATAALLVAGAVVAGDGGGLLRAGALSALSLLALFGAGIALSLAHGRAPDCHCFGQLHSAPAGSGTLARNGALLTLAAFVASGGDLAWTAAAAIAAASTLGVVDLLTRGREENRPEEPVAEGLPPGTPAPKFELPALEGPPVALASLQQRERPLLLVFTDPNCGPCVALSPQVRLWQRRHQDELTITVIERGDGGRPTGPDPHGRKNVLLQEDDEVARAYRAQGTPSAVLVGADGRIASRVAPGRPAIEALLARTLPGFASRGSTEQSAPFTAPLVRRELLARGVAAWAAVTGLIAAPAWATHRLERKCRHERCGDRCCPRKAKCRRRRGNHRVCVCPDGRPACGGRCCPETFVCRRRRRHRRRRRSCVCPNGYIVCSGRCVRTRTDPRHCGRCGKECPPATSCVDGDCVGGDGSGSGPGGSGECNCPLGQTCCGGTCTDLNTSEENCGMCGQPCAEGQTCCEGHCRNVKDDPHHCGKCGKRCRRGRVCARGSCRRRCPSGLTNCDGYCVNTQSDSSNCSECGNKCEGLFDTCCKGHCVSLSIDGNCGVCGVTCPVGYVCEGRQCICPSGDC